MWFVGRFTLVPPTISYWEKASLNVLIISSDDIVCMNRTRTVRNSRTILSLCCPLGTSPLRILPPWGRWAANILLLSSLVRNITSRVPDRGIEMTAAASRTFLIPTSSLLGSLISLMSSSSEEFSSLATARYSAISIFSRYLWQTATNFTMIN